MGDVMPYDDPTLKEFDNYYQARSASQRERAENWAVAIGLQKVDGLVPSEHLISVAKRHIEGEISGAEATSLIDFDREREYSYSGKSNYEIVAHFARFIAGIWQIHPFREGNTRTIAVFAIKYLKSMQIKATNDLFAENSWFFRNALVRANYENLLGRISCDFEPLERFFRNLVLGEKNELKNRYLLVGLKDAEKGQLAAGKEGSQKTVVRKGLSVKGCQKTADKLIELLKAHPSLTQVGMSNALGISRQAVQKHIANLKKSGRLRRIGPDKGGHWEVVG